MNFFVLSYFMPEITILKTCLCPFFNISEFFLFLLHLTFKFKFWKRYQILYNNANSRCPISLQIHSNNVFIEILRDFISIFRASSHLTKHRGKHGKWKALFTKTFPSRRKFFLVQRSFCERIPRRWPDQEPKRGLPFTPEFFPSFNNEIGRPRYAVKI